MTDVLTESFLLRFNVEARQKLYLSRITKSEIPNLITRISLSICVEVLFSQPWTYIRIILRVVTFDANVVALVVTCIL